MLIAEAKWLGTVLATAPETAFPLVNIGSQTAEFQDQAQPWIGEYVTDPVRARGGRIINVDIRADSAVDLVADIGTTAGRDAVRALGAATVLCANVLEHVPDARAMLESLQSLVPPGGHLIVSGPRTFPFHPDPIDTMFRPSWHELAAWLDPDFAVAAAADISCRRLIGYAAHSRLHGMRVAAAALRPNTNPTAWWSRIRWLATRTQSYALVAKRTIDTVPSSG